MDKEIKVVMLESSKVPTEDDILLFGGKLIYGNGLKISIPNNTVSFMNPIDEKWISIAGTNRFHPQHLYFVSNDVIKVGDYCMITDKESVLYGMMENAKNSMKNDQWQKIIASTDPELNLPRINDVFIKEFIKNYVPDFIVRYHKLNVEIPKDIIWRTDDLKNITKDVWQKNVIAISEDEFASQYTTQFSNFNNIKIKLNQNIVKNMHSESDLLDMDGKNECIFIIRKLKALVESMDIGYIDAEIQLGAAYSKKFTVFFNEDEFEIIKFKEYEYCR